ncbi:2-keto-3-deoxy-D-arabino-heptulosonate-7-phosphate synthase I alpha [Photobacterium aphoticum]|uniref:3-deoxy-7-phosphoheptulonate synthase n=1 Tax=Photobacterium aphoticum TaxID=754436 RepID=A0A090RML7_9GAMM|nr:2-keto-3-deoxy-D-arabino-heptulosonate-7-phosphate synthase I alpha [Photobacterium aphoticum]
MQKDSLNNVHIENESVLITPQQLRDKLPVSDTALEFVRESRQTIADIIHKRDHRLLVVCGPCSIHDIEAAKEYAVKLKALSEELQDQLYIVMRVYFEKPRTRWAGKA